MNQFSEQQAPKPASQQEFLTVFLANEREIFRYVAALVPTVGDAQEIVQQTAVALLEKFDDYDRSRPFTPWACRFALNVTRQWMDRRRRWRTMLETGLAEELATRREQLQPEFGERLSHLNHCLGKLPPDHRELVDGILLSSRRKLKRSRDRLSEQSMRFTNRCNGSGGSCESVSNTLSVRRLPFEFPFARIR